MASMKFGQTLTALAAIVALTAVLMLIASALRGAPLNRGGLVLAFIILGGATSRLIRTHAAAKKP